MLAGFLVLVALSLVALSASLAVALRMRLQGRAETLLASAMLFNGLVIGAIHVLAWSGCLRQLPLALLVLGSSALFFLMAWRGKDVRFQFRELAYTARGIARIPFDALMESWRARSFLFVGVAAVLLAVAYTAWLSYLSPSGGWDGIWYHETMVGYALQNDGFAIVELPLTLQYVNGFPRVCEMLNLWMVIFTDKRWIEMVNSIMSVPLVLSVYLLALRLGASRIHAMGWAAALFWMPGTVLQLRSTYIDVHTAAFVLAAAHFTTRPDLRLRDAWLGALCLGLLLGSKGMALAWVPLLGLPFAVRLFIRHWRGRPLATALTAAGALCLISAFAVPFYVRNWLHFDNPVWPVQVFDWPGWLSVSDLNKPLSQFFGDIYSVPVPGKDFHDTRVWGYGLGLPWVVFPAAVLSSLAAFWLLVVRLRRGAQAPLLGQLFLVVGPLLLTMAVSPKLQNARYNIHVAAALMLLVAWAAARFRLERVAESILAVTIATSLIMHVWAKPAWSVTFDQAMTLAAQPSEERTAFQDAGFASTPEYRRARRDEIGPESIVAYTDEYMFPAEFWNERFNNTIRYVPSKGRSTNDVVRDLEGMGADWAIAMEGSALARELTRSERWQRIAAASLNRVSYAFRRVSPAAR